MTEKTSMVDSVEMVVTDHNGKIKNVRVIKGGKEFVPNNFYLKLINSGHIKPTEWKIPLLFGIWKAVKES
jgi:hypothetical protein